MHKKWSQVGLQALKDNMLLEVLVTSCSVHLGDEHGTIEILNGRIVLMRFQGSK
jgi:hypothetical protein